MFERGARGPMHPRPGYRPGSFHIVGRSGLLLSRGPGRPSGSHGAIRMDIGGYGIPIWGAACLISRLLFVYCLWLLSSPGQIECTWLCRGDWVACLFRRASTIDTVSIH